MNSSDQNNPSENNPQRNQQRKGKGRQKVNMVKIENETNLQVTFSKRRAGLFKKASELSTLCGAESAIVVFSPGEKAHSFGNPNVETIANRFLNQNNSVFPRNDHADQLLRAHNDATMRQHNQELVNLEAQLELEKKRKQEQENMRRANQGQNWCPPPIDELNYEQLHQLKRSVMSFKQDFETKVQNATSLADSYAQGTNLEAGIGGGLPWTTSSGSNIGFSFDSSVQGPSHFALYGGKAPLVIGGSSTNLDAGASNPNVAHQTNPGANSSSASLFPELMTSTSGLVVPFDPMVGNNFGWAVQYPPLASSSDVILPYNYNNPSDIVPYGTGTRSNDHSEQQTHSNVYKWQGSSHNYRRGI